MCRAQTAILLAGSILALLRPTAAEAVQVAPNVVFIGADERGAELVLHNPADAPMEFEVEVLFGYEDSDEAGAVKTVYPEGSEAARSAAEWLRAYPARGVLTPGQRQTVRLFRRSPPDLPAGEYWARVSVQSRPTTLQAREAAGENVQVRVGVTTRQRIPVFVRVGAPRASVSLADVRLELERGEASPTVTARYRSELSGSAAFLGSVRARVEKDGRVLAEATSPLALFVSGWRLIRLPVPDAVAPEDLAGARLVLEAVRQHPAVQSRHLLPGEGDRWEGPLAFE